MARVIIAAAGPQHKWGEYLGVPSHLAPVDDEPLLARTIRQALTISEDVWVTYPAGDRRYVETAGAGQPVTFVARRPEYPSEYQATRPLWDEHGRTVLLLGDVYFTDEAIKTIGAFDRRQFQGFGRKGKSYVTNCRYGEMFAASWWPEQHEQQDEYLEIIREHHENKTITRPTGWMLLRAWQGTQLAKHRCEPEWMTVIDDLTEDWDYPIDYNTHPVIRKAVKKMEAGKGHAARNEKLPDLLKRLNVEPRHVVHVGAHDGEEMPFYEAARFGKITLVEPMPDKAQVLREKFPKAEVIQAAATAGGMETVALRVMSVTNMSTIVVSGKDAPVGTINVPAITLADIAPTANVAVVDVQGAELDVLHGANLGQYDIVMVETSTVEDATMASNFDDVTDYMAEQGFRVEEYWVRDYQWVARWGRKRHHREIGEVRDVVYVRCAPSVAEIQAAAAQPVEVEPETEEAPKVLLPIGTKKPRKSKKKTDATDVEMFPTDDSTEELSPELADDAD